jgi:two-component system, LytTR family, response regulator
VVPIVLVDLLEEESGPRRALLELLERQPGICTLPYLSMETLSLPRILARRPDLLISPVNIKSTDMLSILEKHRDPLPAIILLADNSADAFRAFDLHAVDYLIRPIPADRFVESLRRACEHVAMLRSRLEEKKIGQEGACRRFMVRGAGKVAVLAANEIDWVRAQGDYVCLYAGGRKHLLRERISHLEDLLPTQYFVRIHRSIIVNIERVRALRPLLYGEYTVVLTDGTALTMSRSYRGRVLQRLMAAA